MEPFTVGLVAVGAVVIVRALARPNSKATKKNIQRISEQARHEIKQAAESYSTQARTIAQNQKRR